MLLRRSASPDARWAPVDLAAPVLGSPPDPPPGDPLTVAPGHVWIDVALDERRSATLHVDTAGGAPRVTGSWCDTTACTHALGVGLSPARGYRSFAWDGVGFGTRVITGPVDAGARGDGTSRGTWLALADDRFVRRPGTGDDGTQGTQTAAFRSAGEGWLGGALGVTHVTGSPADPAVALVDTSLTVTLYDVARSRAPVSGHRARARSPSATTARAGATRPASVG